MATKARTISERFLDYLHEEGLSDVLPEIATLLQAEALRRQEISVISAETLTDKEKKQLEQTLSEKWGDHPFVFTVDPILLSGLIVKFRDVIIDMSGKHQLTNLAHELK